MLAFVALGALAFGACKQGAFWLWDSGLFMGVRACGAARVILVFKAYSAYSGV